MFKLTSYSNMISFIAGILWWWKEEHQVWLKRPFLDCEVHPPNISGLWSLSWKHWLVKLFFTFPDFEGLLGHLSWTDSVASSRASVCDVSSFPFEGMGDAEAKDVIFLEDIQMIINMYRICFVMCRSSQKWNTNMIIDPWFTHIQFYFLLNPSSFLFWFWEL